MESDSRPSLSEKSQPLDIEPFEQIFFNRAFMAIRVLLMLFTPFVGLQIAIRYFVVKQHLIEMDMFEIGILINLGMIFILATVYILFQTAYRRGWQNLTNCFYPVIVVCAYLVQAVWLIHMHFCGSLNSVMMGLVLVTTMMVAWFLRPRDTIVFFIVGHIAMFLMVLLEYLGILQYAPLLVDREFFASIMLDERVVLTALCLYIVIAGTAITTITNYRKSLEKINIQLGSANRRLEEEIEFRHRSEKDKERLIRQLQDALKEVKKLQGLIPICSICKKIRDDEGSWNQLETYISQHSEAQFSHGLCPECAEKHYGKYTK